MTCQAPRDGLQRLTVFFLLAVPVFLAGCIPNPAKAEMELARSHLERGETEEAERILGRCRKEYGPSEAIALLSAEVLVAMGEPQRACNLLMEAIKENPRSSRKLARACCDTITLEMVNSSEGTTQYNGMTGTLKKLLKLDPTLEETVTTWIAEEVPHRISDENANFVGGDVRWFKKETGVPKAGEIGQAWLRVAEQQLDATGPAHVLAIIKAASKLPDADNFGSRRSPLRERAESLFITAAVRAFDEDNRPVAIQLGSLVKNFIPSTEQSFWLTRVEMIDSDWAARMQGKRRYLEAYPNGAHADKAAGLTSFEKTFKTILGMVAVVKELEEYRDSTGALPPVFHVSQLNEAALLRNQQPDFGTHDAWGSELQIFKSAKAYRIVSMGPDGKRDILDGNAARDDIVLHTSSWPLGWALTSSHPELTYKWLASIWGYSTAADDATEGQQSLSELERTFTRSMIRRHESDWDVAPAAASFEIATRGVNFPEFGSGLWRSSDGKIDIRVMRKSLCAWFRPRPLARIAGSPLFLPRWEVCSSLSSTGLEPGRYDNLELRLEQHDENGRHQCTATGWIRVNSISRDWMGIDAIDYSFGGRCEASRHQEGEASEATGRVRFHRDPRGRRHAAVRRKIWPVLQEKRHEHDVARIIADSRSDGEQADREAPQLSAATRHALAGLERPIEIYGFVSEPLPPPYDAMAQRVRGLLHQFEKASDSISVEMFHPDNDRAPGPAGKARQGQTGDGLARSFGVPRVKFTRPAGSSPYMPRDVVRLWQTEGLFIGIGVTDGEWRRTIPVLGTDQFLEYDLVNAIRSLRARRRIGVVGVPAWSPLWYSLTKRLAPYEVVNLGTTATWDETGGVDALMVLDRGDASKQLVSSVERALENGTPTAFFVDSVTVSENPDASYEMINPSFGALLARHGLVFRPGLIFDTRCATVDKRSRQVWAQDTVECGFLPRSLIRPDTHPISSRFEELIFPYATAIETKDQSQGLHIEAVAWSSGKSFAGQPPFDLVPRRAFPDFDGAFTGPHALAVTATGPTRESTAGPRMIVVGTTGSLLSEVNPGFGRAVCDWLLQSPGMDGVWKHAAATPTMPSRGTEGWTLGLPPGISHLLGPR